MAPKRSSKKNKKRKTVSVQKVVRETIEVALVVDTNNDSNHSHESFNNTSTTTTATTTTTSTVIPIVHHKPQKTAAKKVVVDGGVLEKKKEEENGGVLEKKKKKEEEEEGNGGVLEKKRGGPKSRKKTVFDQAQGGGRGKEEYRRYVFGVLKQVHPGMGISAKAMTVVNSMINDMFERLAEESAKLVKYTGKVTLSSREVQAAVRLVLPGELGRHAMAEGAKAVASYMSS